MAKHPSYCCQRCGENVGYLGKIVEFIYYKIFRLKMFKHNCPTVRTTHCTTIFWQNWSQNEEIQEVLYPEFNFKKRITKHKFIKNG